MVGTSDMQKTRVFATGLIPVFALSMLQLGSSVFSYGNNIFGDNDYGLSTAVLSELLSMVFMFGQSAYVTEQEGR